LTWVSIIRYLILMVGTRPFDEDAPPEVALKTFWQNGFAATSMIDVAEGHGGLDSVRQALARVAFRNTLTMSEFHFNTKRRVHI
jgi:hypothetical protein